MAEEIEILKIKAIMVSLEEKELAKNLDAFDIARLKYLRDSLTYLQMQQQIDYQKSIDVEIIETKRDADIAVLLFKSKLMREDWDYQRSAVKSKLTRGDVGYQRSVELSELEVLSVKRNDASSLPGLFSVEFEC